MSEGVEYGDPKVALPNEIVRTVVGSGVLGIAIEGTDDHDEMGVFIEPPEYVLGVRDYRDNYNFRTKPEGVRSGYGDTDLIIYSLRKYLRLAVKGNPTVLTLLFAPPESVVRSTELGQELRAIRSAFLSDEAVERFLGYMHSQHERMMGGGKRNRVPNRPELIAAHGWDVKYGSHALRLANQGYEIASSGSLTLPLPEAIRTRVLSVKRGEVPRAEVSGEIGDLESRTRALLDTGGTALPPSPDTEGVAEWSIRAHQRHWSTLAK